MMLLPSEMLAPTGHAVHIFHPPVFFSLHCYLTAGDGSPSGPSQGISPLGGKTGRGSFLNPPLREMPVLPPCRPSLQAEREAPSTFPFLSPLSGWVGWACEESQAAGMLSTQSPRWEKTAWS